MRSSGTRCRSRSCPSWPRRPAACAHGAPAPPCGHPRDVRARPGAGGRHRRARGGHQPARRPPLSRGRHQRLLRRRRHRRQRVRDDARGRAADPAAMMGASEPEPAADGSVELTELEASAVSEAMNQMMATAAGAISTVLGTEVEIGTPETRTFVSEAEADGAYPASPHMVRAAFSVCGEPCRLVQLVPNAFVVRMDRALDELGAETVPGAGAAAASASPAAAVQSPHGAPSLAGIPVRVWAELGRASMPTADVVGLPQGAVVELDRAPDEPIDLFVNGRRFATGRLVVVDGDWAVRIESVLDPSSNSSDIEGEVARWPVSS